MGKKLQKYLDEAEKTEQQIAELEERLRTIRVPVRYSFGSFVGRKVRKDDKGS